MGAGAALKGGVLFLLDRARDVVAAHAPASAVAGVAATVVVGSSVFVAVHDPAPSRPATEAGPAAEPADTADAELPAPGRVRDGGQRAAGQEGVPLQQDGDVAAPVAVPTSSPTPTVEGPAPEPTHDPTSPTAPTSPSSEPPPPEPSGPTEPAADLRVTAFATAQAPGAFKVVVAVSGATSGKTTLTVSGEGLSVALTGDGRCATLALGSGSCQVDGNDDDVRLHRPGATRRQLGVGVHRVDT